MSEVRFSPATDLLGHSASLNRVARFPLLGVLIEVRTNSDSVLEAAERAFGHWRAVPSELRSQVPARILEVVVHGDGEVRHEPWGFVQRSHGGRFLAARGADLMMADLDGGRALAFLTPPTVSDDEGLRHDVLDCLALLLVSRQDRTPVHAATVVRGGRAMLLAGPSGAGKSTLCYAALRRGFELLSEEVSYVSVHPSLRVWGNPRRLHLMRDAPTHFPELAGRPVRLLANGKEKLVLEGEEIGPVRLWAERCAVCLLERSGLTSSRWEAVEPAVALTELSQGLEPGFDLHERGYEGLEALVRGGAFRVRVGTDLDEAARMLEQLSTRDEAGAGPRGACSDWRS